MIFKIESKFCKALNSLFYNKFGFNIKDITFSNVLKYMYSPRDPSSLAVVRILFGLAMLFDIPDERGGSQLNNRWGDPKTCHFPLFPFVQAVNMPYMALVYAAMWLGAMGTMLGYKFRFNATVLAVCYWYLFVIEKSFWNNHSYLFGLVALLLVGTSANHYLSVDAYLDPALHDTAVPYWNYFILKYQFFILYFVAGLKKGTAEWLTGYSLPNLSEHWVFDPFKLFLSVSQTDYLIVHWFAFLFDLTIVFWMMWDRTRTVAMIFCAAFHLMNIRLFRIGMFPWVCLATMPLFYPFDWPKKLANYIGNHTRSLKTYCRGLLCTENKDQNTDKIKENAQIETFNDDVFMETNKYCEESQWENHDSPKETHEDDITNFDNKDKNLSRHEVEKPKLTLWLIIIYMFLQAFLPYSHFITKGYNNWTNGLYGYSWDMMVHTWNSVSVTVKVVDNEKNAEFFLDPFAWTPNDRWTRHGDMVYQFAHCVERNIQSDLENLNTGKLWQKNVHERNYRNLSIYIDVWCSMNGRFQQRMFDPKIDLLRVEWSPFEEVEWLMPLLVDAENWRQTMDEIRNDVHSWSDKSEVLFVADFPGHERVGSHKIVTMPPWNCWESAIPGESRAPPHLKNVNGMDRAIEKTSRNKWRALKGYEIENYIPTDLNNITLTVLKGSVGFQPQKITDKNIGQSYVLQSEEKIAIASGEFHIIHVLGYQSSYYMYTYNNASLSEIYQKPMKTKLPVGQEFTIRLIKMVKFFNLLLDSFYQMFFRVPVSIKSN